MVGAVRSLSFSFDGSFVVGGSDEGCGLEIVSLWFAFFLAGWLAGWGWGWGGGSKEAVG